MAGKYKVKVHVKIERKLARPNPRSAKMTGIAVSGKASTTLPEERRA